MSSGSQIKSGLKVSAAFKLLIKLLMLQFEKYDKMIRWVKKPCVFEMADITKAIIFAVEF